MPRLAQSVCVGSDLCFFTWHQMPQCFTPQCPGSAPFARYQLPDCDVSSEQDTSHLHSIPERAREGGCGQVFRNFLSDQGKPLLSGPQFSHLQNGALDGHLYPLYLAAIVTPVLLFIQFQASHGKAAPFPQGNRPQQLSSGRISGTVFWWGESRVGTLSASIVCLCCRLNVFPQTRLINVMALRGGTSGRRLDHISGTLIKGVSVFLKGTQSSPVPSTM